MVPRVRALVLISAALVLGGCNCGSIVIIGGNDAGKTDGGTKPDGGSPTDSGVIDAGPRCTDGDSCGDGGICTGNACCAAAFSCGPQCCTSTTVCSFNTCVSPGGACRDSSECGANAFCDFSQAQPIVFDGGVCAGGALAAGRCLPRPPVCPSLTDGGAPVGAGVTCVEACQFAATLQQLKPFERYSWGNETVSPFASDVMMAPIVTQLDDDDCDGKITANDLPDIVVVTFAGGAYTLPGTVHALSVKAGVLSEKWSRAGIINAGSQLASGNIDGLPGNEVVGCGPGTLVALKADGGDLWTAAVSCGQPSLADLEGDGTVEVITEHAIVDGTTGVIKKTFLTPAAINTVADLDGVPPLDIVAGGHATKADGTELANTNLPQSYVAVADLDKDGKPEVIGVNSSNHTLTLWQYDPASPGKAKIVRTGLDINGTLDPTLCPAGSAGASGGGGPPTVGDFNNDGFPDVALAGGVGYAVLDGKKLMDPAVANAATFLWTRQTRDCSSAATGSALFDFDGDGKTEAVYADEISLHIYESATGNDRFTTCNTSGTLIELPVVADIDNDGQADIVVVSNAYAFACADGSRKSGVRVFSAMDNNWVRTRRVWNQHAYSVTNIEEDGTVPSVQRTNWLQPGLNNFRQNKQPGSEFSAADVVGSVDRSCELGQQLRVQVRNLGEAPLPPGIPVDLMKGAPGAGTLLGTATTTRTLGPAQGERLTVPVTDTAVLSGMATIYVVVRPPPSVRECRPNNNTSAPIARSCIN